MSIEFKLPDLGENIESGDVVALLVKVGDRIETQQAVLELETDKAVIEVPSSLGGVVKEIHVQEGDKAMVGQLLLTIDSDGVGQVAERPREEASASEVPPPPEPPPEEARPEQAETVEKEADEKASPPDQAAAVVAFAARPSTDQEGLQRVVPASPAIRRVARELGVDIRRVTGTGPRGRITKDDLQQAAAGEAPAGRQPQGLPSASQPDFARWGEIETESFTNVRRVTAERMAHNWLTVPHVTQHDECDVTELEKRRKQYAARAEAAGTKLTVTAIIIKLLASALKLFPDFNASIDAEGQRIIYKKYIHIGVAVDTPRGLLVPVIRDVDQKNIIQIAVELQEVAGRARDGKLTLDEMQGGTFTVTNLGGIGGTSFTPIVNWPEVAILGVSRSAVKAVFRDGSLVPRTMLPLSLSYDHRLINGANAARFLRWLSESLEDPFLSILEG